MEPWFKKAFGKHYLSLYASRDLGEAERYLDFLADFARLKECNGRVFDCACGAGRHSALLHLRGIHVTGLDFSADLLREAKKAGLPRLVRGDMRRLPFKPVFERVLSLFTSFGYFEDDSENASVLGEMAGVLRSGGLLLLDYLNPATVRESDWTEVEWKDGRARNKKEIIGDRVVKTWRLTPADGTPEFDYREEVKLYPPEWFREQAGERGLGLVSLVGDYKGAEFTAESPRSIFLFEKTAE